MLEDVEYCYSQSVAFSFMQKLSLKAALREWGSNATEAGDKEINQLHWRKMFVPRQMSEITAEQRTKILQSHTFMVQRRKERSRQEWSQVEIRRGVM